MRRPNTSPVVAAMKNPEPFWDWSVFQFPGKAVSVRGSIGSGDVTLPVTRRRNAGSPIPACFGLFNFTPEAFCHGSVIAELGGSSTKNVLRWMLYKEHR